MGKGHQTGMQIQAGIHSGMWQLNVMMMGGSQKCEFLSQASGLK